MRSRRGVILSKRREVGLIGVQVSYMGFKSDLRGVKVFSGRLKKLEGAR